jgi:hypothetical protein
MTTLQPDSHTQRIAAGDTVLARAAHVDTKPIKPRLFALARVHVQLLRAQKTLDAEEARLAAATEATADTDLDQDAAVEALATALVGDGQPRKNPFQGLGVGAPSDVRRAPYEAAAQAIEKLAKALQKRTLSPASRKALKSAQQAARRVLAALDKRAHAEARVDDARERRDALVLPWTRAFSALKRAARAAADDGHAGLFDALFAAEAPRAKKPRAKKPAAG